MAYVFLHRLNVQGGDFSAEPKYPEEEIITNTIDDPKNYIEKQEITLISTTSDIQGKTKANTLSSIDSKLSIIISDIVDSAEDEITDEESLERTQKEFYSVYIEILEEENEIKIKNETNKIKIKNVCEKILDDPGDEKEVKFVNETKNEGTKDINIINKPVSSKLKSNISKLYSIDQPDSVLVNYRNELSNIELENNRDEDIRDTNTLNIVIDKVILKIVPTDFFRRRWTSDA